MFLQKAPAKFRPSFQLFAVPEEAPQSHTGQVLVKGGQNCPDMLRETEESTKNSNIPPLEASDIPYLQVRSMRASMNSRRSTIIGGIQGPGDNRNPEIYSAAGRSKDHP